MYPSTHPSMHSYYQHSLSHHSHYTKTSTWTDPRSLSPQPLKDFNWESLPPGWERFMDQEGDIYYVK